VQIKEGKRMPFDLEGIRVIETATVMAGPMASRLLADWGAEVIKVEHPIRGDMARSIKLGTSGAKLGTPGAKRIESDINYDGINHNCGKRSMTLDISQERGRAVLDRLLAQADVFVSNFRQRELVKFKLEYETLSQLNPRLVCANISGYGKKGPHQDAPAYDTVSYWARSGFLHLLQRSGSPPPVTPLGSGDRSTALVLALGIMTALFIRERTGVGQQIDASLFNTAVYTIASEIGGALVTGQDLQQPDRKDGPTAMATYYRTKDGRWLRLGLLQADLYWESFCQAIERKDLTNDPRFSSNEPRLENRSTLMQILDEVFSTKPLSEWAIRLTEAGLPWGPVQNLLEVTTDPQARANDFFMPYEHPIHGHIEIVANPVKLSRTTAIIRKPAPEFGQHTEEILLELGYSWDDITQFKEQGTIA
jgi:crotonobetainyl-CoA:carnitine CoA-transferase CaiB-like acyl-CoA transferase